jgi:hypothetical protein
LPDEKSFQQAVAHVAEVAREAAESTERLEFTVVLEGSHARSAAYVCKLLEEGFGVPPGETGAYLVKMGVNTITAMMASRLREGEIGDS